MSHPLSRQLSPPLGSTLGVMIRFYNVSVIISHGTDLILRIVVQRMCILMLEEMCTVAIVRP